MTTLEALRIFGPLDGFEIQAKTQADLNDVVGDILELQKHSHAYNPYGCVWDVTEAGRQAFTRHQAVRRDEARACVGVSHAE